MSDAIRAIADRRRDWIAAVNRRDVDAYLDVLAPDVVWLPPGQSAIEGREAFGDWVRPFFEAYEYYFSIEDPVVSVSGDFAVERGRFATEMTPIDGGNAMTHEGDYLVFWRRIDSRWMIERYADGSYL